MCKKILRFLSLALAIILAVSVTLPAPATAAAITPDEIKQQIRSTYRKARAHYGFSSFDGYCGSLVNAQLYIMGITTSVSSADGNDEYDRFANLSVTSGGYSVKAYPAKTYTLRSALNDITNNGTRDAYNILVGFQKTRSAAGQIYGHACVIHAIIDGTVYFMESYNTSLDGKYYPEGTPMTCSIDTFCKYYATFTTQFDGVIYFGLKTYADSCSDYAASAWGSAAEGTQLWSQPCESEVSESSKPGRQLSSNEKLNITGLYLNTVGEYWYQIDDGESGYVRAEDVSITQLRFDDVSVVGVTAPTVLVKGKPFNVKGTILSEMNDIYSVRAKVYSMDGQELTQVINSAETVSGKNYELSGSDVSRKLTFRSLSAGSYRYELAVILNNYYVENGQLLTGWQTVNLWSADFLVVEKQTGVSTITFNACGGTTGLNRTVAVAGQSVGSLSVAQRPGYVFLGWFTEAEGGQRITADFVAEGNITFYAHWISMDELRAEWMNNSNCWYLYADGISTMGCIEVGGNLYYFSMMDPMGQNWMLWAAAGAA